MKYGIANEHKDFFDRHRAIEFDAILSPDECIQIVNAIRCTLSEKLAVEQANIFEQNPLNLYEAGRDLWRQSVAIKHMISQRSFAQLAFQLLKKKPLRIAYDQYFPSLKRGMKRGKYADFLRNRSSLKEISSLQGIVCGLFFFLHSCPVESAETICFPHQRGSLVILHPEAKIEWPLLLDSDSEGYYLVVYGGAKTFYIRNCADPLAGFLVPQGYSSGDRLIDEKNPVILR